MSESNVNRKKRDLYTELPELYEQIAPITKKIADKTLELYFLEQESVKEDPSLKGKGVFF